ncbi:hypothetical protein E2320_017835, partial [Naja naja]
MAEAVKPRSRSKTGRATAKGVCADQCKVSGFHRYQTVEVNEGALGELKRLFDAQTEHLHQVLALHLYTSVLSRLQTIESPSSDLESFKDCISVLFSFTRRLTEDPQFKRCSLVASEA